MSREEQQPESGAKNARGVTINSDNREAFGKLVSRYGVNRHVARGVMCAMRISPENRVKEEDFVKALKKFTSAVSG